MSESKPATGESKVSESKLWGGRFTGGLDPLMQAFNDSLSFDKRMWRQDLRGSRAYATALVGAGLLTEAEASELHRGLDLVAAEWQSGSFVPAPSDEDIHTANERRLKELVGAPAAKLHTGRSRNDQVATDIRLWLMDYLSDELLPQLRRLINTLVSRAESETGVLMPGYTHLQRAQPVRWSHWLLSYASMLRRDCQRLADCRARTAVCPLGSGALAGNPFGVDRQALADALGFTSGVTWNSLDAVADRDFASEFQFAAAMLGNHLSRLAEDLILFCSKEFGFVTLSDAYSTGSSLMPQKKNADSLELIRGKTGRLCGHLVSLLMVQKSLPSAFNKDLQEDKEGLFDSADTVSAVVRIADGVVATLTVHPEACAGALSCDMLATDLAYYLVRRGVPFREAHAASGRCVALAEAKACQLHQLTFEDFRTVSEKFGEDVTQLWDFETSVEQYGAFGGTALESVRQQVAAFRRWLGDEQK
ncbi:hypothetical protein BOX15_Mlig033546g1 [Macrostomum lignano]|uniref:Argininosuccinate lyase n=2 Tax=Macrostomum lignano TaxID=282301 RepID=A0A267DN11_9PLAT|nr:hypothetical protein BOX15_Mlig033546g1 [Macrostomum lignano]